MSSSKRLAVLEALEDVGTMCKVRNLGGNPGANLNSISYRCHPILGAFVWELTKTNVNLPLGYLRGGYTPVRENVIIEEARHKPANHHDDKVDSDQ